MWALNQNLPPPLLAVLERSFRVALNTYADDVPIWSFGLYKNYSINKCPIEKKSKQKTGRNLFDNYIE